jgi:hypothetical protein
LYNVLLIQPAIAIDVDDAATCTQAAGGSLRVQGVGLTAPSALADPDADPSECVASTEQAGLLEEATTVTGSAAATQLQSALDVVLPDLRARLGSIIGLAPVVTPPANGFLESANYLGAIAPAAAGLIPWYSGWTVGEQLAAPALVTLNGVVSAPGRGGIAGVQVQVSPSGLMATTNALGQFAIAGVPTGPVEVAFTSGVPAECATPEVIRATANGGTMTLADVRVACGPPAPVTPLAAQFDGSGNITIPHSASLGITGAFTIEAWVLSDPANTADFNDFLSKLDGGLAYTTWSFRINNGANLTGGVVFSGAVVRTDRGMGDPSFTSNTLRGVWQHIAATWNGVVYRSFLNGRLVGETEFAPSSAAVPVFGTTPITLGAQNGLFRSFRGRVDEVRISSVARYSEAFTPALGFLPDGETRGLWSFDDVTGTTVPDRSGNNNVGTITGGVTIVAGGPPGVPAVGAVTQSLRWAGNATEALAGQAVTVPPTVQVKDLNGQPVAGITVTFAVATGGGTLVGANAVSNADGLARPSSWTLGAAGAQSVTATTAGAAMLTFNATAR